MSEEVSGPPRAYDTQGRATPSSRARAALDLLKRVNCILTPDFSGLGIVIYESLAALPYLPLESGTDETLSLPVVGLDSVSVALARAASRSTRWHDGFHFLTADAQRLTHMSQFISPPLTAAARASATARGARQMTALLTSRVAGIHLTAVITQERFALLYEAGALRHRESLS